MRAHDLSFDDDTLLIRPWLDPVVDDIGHDPRSAYVERFWLGILGPSTTFFLRHVVERLDEMPDGYELVLGECATALGLGRLQAAGAAFPRTVGRTCQFGAARFAGPGVLEVRRKLPPLTSRQLRRLPRDRQAEHARWGDGAPVATSAVSLRDRARRLALSLVELGEDREGTERQLHRWRFQPGLATEATDWALLRHATRSGAAPLVLAPPADGPGVASAVAVADGPDPVRDDDARADAGEEAPFTGEVLYADELAYGDEEGVPDQVAAG